MHGLLIINKPLKYSSMDVIRRIRKLTGIRKVGHAGSLDPLATGVLLVCLGNYTKKISYLMDKTKEYIAEINLSAFSETDDAEGIIEPLQIKEIPSIDMIKSILNSFIGSILQTPPKYSAVKINGMRAYKKALLGQEFKINPRLITIYSIELIYYEWPMLKIKVVCGKGTYIRSLARDIGIKLHTGGYLSALVRTTIGNYKLENALNLLDINIIQKTDMIDI